MKKSLKQFIFEKMSAGEYVTDTMLAKFCGGEPNYYQAEVYKSQFRKIERDREFFADKNITRIEHYRRNYKAQLDNQNSWYRIGKDYYNEIKPQFIKDNSRPDLEMEMLKRNV